MGIFFAITGEVSEPGVSAVGKSVGKSLGKTHHVDHHVDDLGWFLYVFILCFFKDQVYDWIDVMYMNGKSLEIHHVPP